jgi:hypothetical protein
MCQSCSHMPHIVEDAVRRVERALIRNWQLGWRDPASKMLASRGEIVGGLDSNPTECLRYIDQSFLPRTANSPMMRQMVDW